MDYGGSETSLRFTGAMLIAIEFIVLFCFPGSVFALFHFLSIVFIQSGFLLFNIIGSSPARFVSKKIHLVSQYEQLCASEG